jgi:hypothetical protein
MMWVFDLLTAVTEIIWFTSFVILHRAVACVSVKLKYCFMYKVETVFPL